MIIFTEEQLVKNSIMSALNTGEEINILCCVNDKFANPMINLMYSIRNFCDRKINLYVLTTQMNEETVKLIQEKMDKINVRADIKHVELPAYNISSWCWSLDVYLKVLGFEFLPKTVEKILYLDADIIALNDISKLYDIDVTDCLIACAVDSGVNQQRVYERRRTLNIKHDYFNSGVLLYNVKKQREVWTFDDLSVKISNGEFEWPDQDFLNSITSESDIKFIPYMMNFQNWGELDKDADFDVFSPILVHFITIHKPWVVKNLNQAITRVFYECGKLTGLQEYNLNETNER